MLLVQEEASGQNASASLMNRYQGIQNQAEHWRQRKAHRLQDFTSLQVQLLHPKQADVLTTAALIQHLSASWCYAE